MRRSKTEFDVLSSTVPSFTSPISPSDNAKVLFPSLLGVLFLSSSPNNASSDSSLPVAQQETWIDEKMLYAFDIQNCTIQTNC